MVIQEINMHIKLDIYAFITYFDPEMYCKTSMDSKQNGLSMCRELDAFHLLFFVCLFVCLFVRLFVYLFVCLFACFFLQISLLDYFNYIYFFCLLPVKQLN